MTALRDLIAADMKPALGVTEPSAIALACAKARSLTDGAVKNVVVRVNSGIYKNAFTCGIPGTSEVGNKYSAALGIVCGNAERGLCVLENLTDENVLLAGRMIESGMVTVEIDSISPVLYISATVETEHDVCRVVVQGEHTNFCHIEKNGKVLFHREYKEAGKTKSPLAEYKIADLLDFALHAPYDDLKFMNEAYALNIALAEAGRTWDRCRITAEMIRQNGGGFLSGDVRMSAKTLACAAAEARVLGINKAAMSITGSGTHGIICTLPIEAYCRLNDIDNARKMRATAISYLITMYIKEYSGKLSAFCGCGIAGGTGLSCALTYLMTGGVENAGLAINNMAASITGMICSGGNHCCCLKVVSAIDAAFTAASLAANNTAVGAVHGICDAETEKTVRNMGLIADPGMVETEKYIVEIMQGKNEKAASI